MSPEAQRVAIAKACGWTTGCGWDDSLADNVFYGACPAKGIEWEQCPDFLSDLNAIREARKAAFANSPGYYDREFVNNLRELVGYDECGMMEKREVYQLLCASAAQECEATLKTLNLWTP